MNIIAFNNLVNWRLFAKLLLILSIFFFIAGTVEAKEVKRGIQTEKLEIGWNIVGGSGTCQGSFPSTLYPRLFDGIQDAWLTTHRNIDRSLILVKPGYPVSAPPGTYVFKCTDGDKSDTDTLIVKDCDTGEIWDSFSESCKTRPEPTGTVVVEDCSIPVGESSCNTRVIWQSHNFINPTTVKRGNTTFSTDVTNSGVEGRPLSGVTIGSNSDTYKFYLFDGTNKIDEDTLEVTCKAGSVWDGRKCKATSLPSGTIYGNGCTISPNQSSCISYVVWESANFVGTPIVKLGSRELSRGTANSRLENIAISPNNRDFALYDGTTLRATSSPFALCDSSTGTYVWDGRKCTLQVSQPPSATISATSCEIPVDGTKCVSYVTWSTSNFRSTPHIMNYNVTMSTEATGNRQSRELQPNLSRGFSILDGINGPVVAEFSADVRCVTGSTWKRVGAEYKCVEGSDEPPTEDHWISATACEIPIGGTGCSSLALWGTTLTTPFIYNYNVLLSNANSGRASRILFPDLTREFSIKDVDGSIYAEFSADVRCVTGSTWKRVGSVYRCVVNPDTPTEAHWISATPCTIPVGEKKCSSYVSWRTNLTNPFIYNYNAQISSDPTGDRQERWVSPDLSKEMTIRDGFYPGGTVHARTEVLVNCVSGSTWTEISPGNWLCKADIGFDGPRGTISATACTIPINSGSCPSTITWSSMDFNGTPYIIYVDSTVSNLPSGSVSLSVNPSMNRMTLTDDGFFIDETYADAQCATGSTWNYSTKVCVADTSTLPPTDPPPPPPPSGNNCTVTSFTVLPPVPVTPTGLSVTTAPSCGGGIKVSWNSVMYAASYKIKVGDEPYKDIGNILSYYIDNKVSGQTYVVSVIATNAAGDSAPATGSAVASNRCTILTVGNCTIPNGRNYCTAQVTWDIRGSFSPNIHNITRDESVSTRKATSSPGFTTTLVRSVATPHPNNASNGANQIEARDGFEVLARATGNAECDSESFFLGTSDVCVPYPKVSISASTTLIRSNESAKLLVKVEAPYNISCRVLGEVAVGSVIEHEGTKSDPVDEYDVVTKLLSSVQDIEAVCSIGTPPAFPVPVRESDKIRINVIPPLGET